MPVEEWPDADQSAWRAALCAGSLLDANAGPARAWKPKTIRTIAQAYGRFLTFLEHRDWLDRGAGPVSRMSEDRLRTYLAELQGTVAPVTLYGRANNLGRALSVMLPGRVYPYLTMARRRLKARATPKRNKRALVVPVHQLVELGAALVRRAKAMSVGRSAGVHRAVLYRDGLMILLLAFRPIRRDNFAGLQIGTGFTKIGDRYVITLSGAETKNGRTYEQPFDARLTPLIDDYIGECRPALLKGAQSANLWISQEAKALSGHAIAGITKMHTRRALGRAVSPHRFRDCATTTLADEAPEHVWVAMSLLQHVDPRTTEKHYNQAVEAHAVVRYQDTVLKVRKGARRHSPRPTAM